jgi:hypothetical protein
VDSTDQDTASNWSAGDPVAVGTDDASLFNRSSGESVTVTSVGIVSDASVYAATGDYTQQTNSGDGSVVVLDDNSIWHVVGPDQGTASAWTDGDAITVNDSSGSGYELVNTDQQSSVHANYIGDE